MNWINILLLGLAAIVLCFIVIISVYLMRWFLKILKIQMKQQPDVWDLFMGMPWMFFYADTFGFIKSRSTRAILNFFLDIVINLLVVILSISIMAGVIYLISKFIS